MSTGNYPPTGQPEPADNYAGANPPAAGTPARADATTGPAATPVMPETGRQAPVAQAPGTPTAGTESPDATPTSTSLPARPAAGQPQVTRAGVVWAAVVAALVLLILLIIFILQNQEQVAVRYFALEGFVPLGMALFIASVSGGVLVAVAGGARILQLRRNAHRARSAKRK
ncbi:MAG: lipopolysaccharide assembly protein LapA domain-containing protein [Arthrobacter sp.]